MEIVDGHIGISFEELTEAIMTRATINNLVRRKQVVQLRKGGNGRSALYDVSSFPLKHRTRIYERRPDLQEQAESKEFVDTIEPDAKALDFFQSYKLADGRNLPKDKVLEYASNAAVMNAFRRCWEAHVSKRQRTGKKAVAAKEFWARAAAALPRLADSFPHSLPGSARRLQMKFQEYLQQGYVCFISGKYLNGNAAKVLKGEQEDYLLSVLNDPQNVTDTLAAQVYNRAARVYGWSEITPGAVGPWRKKYNLEVEAGRLGVTRFRSKRTMQVKRFRPTAPFLMCSLDGWTVELLYQKTRTDKNGHNVTTYTNRLTIVVVLDPCVDYPMGYAVGDHECPELIKEALRNAALHSRELTGQMLRYNQIQSDRYAIGKMAPLYAILGDKVTPAQAHNAKAKPVEAYFKHLNVTYCQLCRNWSGFGVTTNPNRQPNSEALNKFRHKFPDEAGLRQQIDEMMRLEREAKRAAVMQKLANLKPEHTLPMSREMFLLNFGATTGFKNILEGQGLRPTILGVKRDYDCFDPTIRAFAHERWSVKYDPEDLSTVLAVNDAGTRRYIMEAKYVQPMALADRRDGDAEQLQRVRDFNKALEVHTAERMASRLKAAEQVIMGTPALRGSIEDRLLITDSRGQHKDRRSQKRLTAADIANLPISAAPQQTATSGDFRSACTKFDALDVEAIEVPITAHGDSDTEEFNYSNF